MTLKFEDYETQKKRWPQEGRHILAQFDQDSVVVYQAYGPEIGSFVNRESYFGGPFKLTRMSWIKPNFLWMMYRCGWASKPGQTYVFAVRIKREAFNLILSQAVHSSFVSERYDDRAEWSRRLKESNVRLQWDPDHGIHGGKQRRRAIQLGLRGEVLRSYAKEWIIDIEDVSERVRNLAQGRDKGSALMLPQEDVYPVFDDEVSRHLGLSPWPSKTNSEQGQDVRR